MKWTWAGHFAKRNDNKWTLILTTWRPLLGKKNQARKCVRWIDDITRFVGTANWYQKAQDREFGGHEMLTHIPCSRRKMLDNRTEQKNLEQFDLLSHCEQGGRRMRHYGSEIGRAVQGYPEPGLFGTKYCGCHNGPLWTLPYLMMSSICLRRLCVLWRSPKRRCWVCVSMNTMISPVCSIVRSGNGMNSAVTRCNRLFATPYLRGIFGFRVQFESLESGLRRYRVRAEDMPRSRPIVLSGPSGCGKSTLIKRLMKEFPDKFGFSVSHTTRLPRPGEVHGKDYHFTTKDAMQKEIDDGEFVEHAVFNKNLYGTSIRSVQDVFREGKTCILDIDRQGVISIKNTDLDCLLIFVKPPSLKELECRLRGRGTETEDSIQSRLNASKEEITYAELPNSYDYKLVNDDLDATYDEFKAIIDKEVIKLCSGDEES